MDYYRRFPGDYLAGTQDLSMLEDGAYNRMLDYVYSKEKPLPKDLEKVYEIVRATTAKTKAAVRNVLHAHFVLEEDGWHNERADEELAVALPKIANLQRVARENGKLGGRPRKPGSGGSAAVGEPVDKPGRVMYKKPDREPEPEPNPAPFGKQPPSTIHNTNPISKQAPHGIETTEAPVAPLALADARLDPTTPAALLASVLYANGIKATAFHPLVVEWAQAGLTIDRLRACIATARMRKGSASIPVAYLDPIVGDRSSGEHTARTSWRVDDAAALALCTELGIKGPGMGEGREAWHRRIETALGARARALVA